MLKKKLFDINQATFFAIFAIMLEEHLGCPQEIYEINIINLKIQL